MEQFGGGKTLLLRPPSKQYKKIEMSEFMSVKPDL